MKVYVIKNKNGEYYMSDFCDGLTCKCLYTDDISKACLFRAKDVAELGAGKDCKVVEVNISEV